MGINYIQYIPPHLMTPRYKYALRRWVGAHFADEWSAKRALIQVEKHIGRKIFTRREIQATMFEIRIRKSLGWYQTHRGRVIRELRSIWGI